MTSDVLKAFAEMMVIGAKISADNAKKKQWEKYQARLEALFMGVSDDTLKLMWDNVDCDKCEAEYCCDEIHAELNRRGHGSYCAV